MADRKRAYLKGWKSENWVKTALYVAVCGARKRAEKKGVPFRMDSGHVMRVLESQGGVCALSGLPFRKTDVKGQKSAYSPSLDRIKPELGYVEGNVRVILDGLNSLKAHGTDEDLTAICRAVVEKNS